MFYLGGSNMIRNILILTIFGGMLFLTACETTSSIPDIDKGSAEPGGSVNRKGQPMKLLGDPIAIGKPLPSVKLTEAGSMKRVDLSQENHYLGEKGDKLPANVQRITISRDTPFAQMRFAEEAKLKDIRYLSDYREGEFGRAAGLLIDDLRLLARTVVLVDKTGIVRYIQVVPEITRIPDMEKAFTVAADLSQ
jgi:thiol peroxidase